MERLIRYFTGGIEDGLDAGSVGIEVETSFVDSKSGNPITIQQSQKLLEALISRLSWQVTQRKGNLITEISDNVGNRFLYELGRQNIEFASMPYPRENILQVAEKNLAVLSRIGLSLGIKPHTKPVLKTDENLLVIPDERDKTWLELDGQKALELLARISSVQFTISVSTKSAIPILNKLGENIGKFLRRYPQEEYWRRYIKESNAGYDALRYGGPLFFEDIEDYCRKLIVHDVVLGPWTNPLTLELSPPRLVPYGKVVNLDIPLYLRSIWWYFRLKRYGNTLCIEIRPLGRWDDDMIGSYLYLVFEWLGLNKYSYSDYYPGKYFPDLRRPESY